MPLRSLSLLAAVVLLGALVTGCARARRLTGDTPAELTVDGLTRTYRVFVPHGLGTGPAPLVLAFHGRHGTGRDMERLTGFSRLAEKDRFVVAYPDGIGRSWNNGSGAGAADRRDIDDSGFVRALIDRLAGTLPVDRRRVYAVGFSNGAIFTQRLACDLGGQLAAVTAVAGPMAPSVARTCIPARPVPVLQAQGTADSYVPPGGGHTAGGGVVQPVTTTVRGWVDRDSCRPDARTVTPATTVDCEVFGGCAGGASVELCWLTGSGHTWPGSAENPPQTLVGPADASFDMTRYAYTFFRAHALPR